MLVLFGSAVVAIATLSACGDPECLPKDCLNGEKYQTCQTCENSVCTITAKSPAGEKIADCTFPDAANNPSAENMCNNDVDGAAESWCVMHAQS